MDLSRLPVYGFFRAWELLPRKSRFLIGTALIAAVLLAGLWLFNFYAPQFWCLDLKAVPQSNSEQVVMQELFRDYRSVNLLALASYSYVNYISSAIEPHLPSALILAIALAAGWSLLLAVSSGIEGFWGYVIYFFHGCFIYFSDFGLLWGGVSGRMAVSLGIILPVIILAYLFRMRSLNLPVYAQFLVFLLIHAGLYIGAHLYDPAAGLYQTATYGLPVMLLLAMLHTLFISKEFTTAAVFWAVNRKEVSKRKGFGPVLALTAGVLVLQGLALAREFNYLSLPSFFVLRPIHFWIPAGFLSFFLSSNLQDRMKITFGTPTVFYGWQAGWLVLSLATMAFLQGAMEYSALREWHKSIGLVMTAGTFFHLVYLLANFAKVIAAKFNAYVLLLLPRTIGIEAVFFSTAAIFILVQGLESWRATRSWICTWKNMHGDVHMLRRDLNDARNYYREASFFGGDVKSNFNMASIYITEETYQNSEDTSKIILNHYEEAFSRFPFEPAVLNQAHFYSLLGQIPAGIEAYEKALKRFNLPLAHANVAGLYFSENRPDPAILHLKKAVEADPDRAELYSNLGLIYLRYDKKKEAQEFMQAAYDLAPRNPNVLENYLFTRFYLGKRKDIPYDDNLPDEPEYYLANLNNAIAGCAEGKYMDANTAVSKLLKRNITPEASFLRLTTQAMLDSFPNAQSRLKWIAETYPEYNLFAQHNMAAAYFDKGAPEMAVYHFDQSAKAGLKINLMNAARMMVSAGNHKMGYDLFISLKDSFPELRKEIIREMTLIDYAYDLEKQHLEWNMNDITYDESMRGALLAFANKQQIALAEEYLTKVVDSDSTQVMPYYEIGKMYLALGKPQKAMDNLKWGLKRSPENPLINSIMAKAEMLNGNLNAAAERIERFSDSQLPEVQNVRAEIAARKGQTKEAEKIRRQIFARNPFYKEAIFDLVNDLNRQKKYKESVDLLGKALEYNNRNDLLWFYFAESNKLMGSFDWARDAYQNAITYSVSDVNTVRFADTLKAIESRYYGNAENEAEKPENEKQKE